MSSKKIAVGIVIGVVVTLTVCYIIYLQNEKNLISKQNDLLKQRKITGKNDGVVSINTVPKAVRQDFKATLTHVLVTPFKETYHGSIKRVRYLKDIIENRDGYKLLYNTHKPVAREMDLHILYDLTWYETKFDVNKELNNGRGPVDFKVSLGLDQTLVEFKLGSNPQLKRNLQNQLSVYGKANPHAEKITAIVMVTEKQEKRVNKILQELNMQNRENIITIDARNDNKPSASVA
jgi:hypothetical protein